MDIFILIMLQFTIVRSKKFAKTYFFKKMLKILCRFFFVIVLFQKVHILKKFQTQFSEKIFFRHEDLKQMLDANKDGLKLEAMKRIIGMIAKGRDASDLFPAVVKNVVSKNLEVKKLVYVYLVRYAEEQQDLALLSISTFQRALKVN